MRALLSRVKRLLRDGNEVIPIRLVEQLVVVSPGDPEPPPAPERPPGQPRQLVLVTELIVLDPDGKPLP
jgi:hypothetical protein